MQPQYGYVRLCVHYPAVAMLLTLCTVRVKAAMAWFSAAGVFVRLTAVSVAASQPTCKHTPIQFEFVVTGEGRGGGVASSEHILPGSFAAIDAVALPFFLSNDCAVHVHD